MGGDHIAKDEDQDLTYCKEMVQFVLLSIITDTHEELRVGLSYSLLVMATIWRNTQEENIPGFISTV